jgi:hypothetical protein
LRPRPVFRESTHERGAAARTGGMPTNPTPGITTVLIALGLLSCTGCAPRFDKGDRLQDEFDRDDAQCLRDNTRMTAARYGPSRRTDWDAYELCMSAKGYRRR